MMRHATNPRSKDSYLSLPPIRQDFTQGQRPERQNIVGIDYSGGTGL